MVEFWRVVAVEWMMAGHSRVDSTPQIENEQAFHLFGCSCRRCAFPGFRIGGFI